MKKTVLLLVALVCTIAAKAQYEAAKQVFESPKLKESVAKHKLVAILPFETKISFKNNQRILTLMPIRKKKDLWLTRSSRACTLSCCAN